MNRITITLIVGLSFLCTNLNAQNVALEGKVLDSVGKPLELANVIAISTASGAISSYSITDAQGRYKLLLSKDSLYTVKASYLGFDTWEGPIKISTASQKDIVLKASPNQLDAVTVVEDFPVTISGDTITYKADAFTDGKEKKLEDVIEQLPGFEVDDEGQIKVQGKNVQKVLVEGKEFFDGDTKMATKNIPANAVDKVQVLRDFNEIGPLKGVNDGDALALNIKLKEGKKNLWFGDISAGGGPEDRNLIHPNIFYYSPKVNVNFIGDINNIGQQAFTLRDYFRFNGGIANLAQRSGSSLNLSDDEIGLSLLQNNQAQNIDSKLAALNFNYNPNKKIRFSGFGIVTGTDTRLSSVSQRTYIRQDGDNNEVLTSGVDQKNTSGLLKLSATYTPNAKLHLDYDAFIKGSSITDNNVLNSNFASLSNDLSSLRSRDPFSIQQVLNAFYAKDDKNIFSLESTQQYKEQVPNYRLATGLAPFSGTLPLIGNAPFDLFQQKKVVTQNFDAEFNYYRVLNKINHISLKAGVSMNNQSLTSELSELVNGTQQAVGTDNTFTNTVDFNFLDAYIGLGYRVKFGKLTLGPKLIWHNYAIDNTQLGSVVQLRKDLLLPVLNSRYDISSTQRLQLRYAVEAVFPDIQNLTAASELQSYNGLFVGNRNLENEWYHTANLNYSNFSMFTFTTIYGGLSYQKKYESIGSTVDFVGLDRISSVANIDAPNETMSANMTFEKRFPFLKTRFQGTLAYNKFNTLVNGISNFNNSFTQDYTLSMETRFREAPNVEVGMKKRLNDYTSVGVENKFVTNSPFANVEAYFLKGFALTADYEFNDYKNRNGTVRSTYDFLNAALYYQKEDSKWEFKLSGTNLLNTETIRRDGFSNNLISTLEYVVQPRYFMFGVKYEL